MNTYNEIANLKRHIDQAFDSADKEGFDHLPPWAKVMAIDGHTHKDEALSSKETSFLIRAKVSELLNRVHLIQRRGWNMLATSEKYNELRMQMDTFLKENAEDTEIDGGTIIQGILEGWKAQIAKLEEVKLNSLLGKMMEFLEADDKEAFNAASEFKEIATKHFATDFPEFAFQKDTD
ncbi:MAG: hypothetical protein QNK92_08695 [Amylibacter sp.]